MVYKGLFTLYEINSSYIKIKRRRKETIINIENIDLIRLRIPQKKTCRIESYFINIFTNIGSPITLMLALDTERFLELKNALKPMEDKLIIEDYDNIENYGD
jgi:hypothetical protein